MQPPNSAPSIVWSLHRQGRIATCEVIFGPNEADVRILVSGSAPKVARFADPEEALTAAEAERNTFLIAGWLAVD